MVSKVAASNPLSERQDQFLQGRGSKRDPGQIQDKNLGTIRRAEPRSPMIAIEGRTFSILEQL